MLMIVSDVHPGDGHTHHHVIVPFEQHRLYFNSGARRSYDDLAIRESAEQRFVQYDTHTFLALSKEDDRSGRRFETWSGAYR